MKGQTHKINQNFCTCGKLKAHYAHRCGICAYEHRKTMHKLRGVKYKANRQNSYRIRRKAKLNDHRPAPIPRPHDGDEGRNQTSHRP